MLNLEEIERAALQSGKALTTTSEGDETLRGLTVAESQFVLAVERAPDQNAGAADSALYHHLRQVHAETKQLHVLTTLRSAGKRKDLS